MACDNEQASYGSEDFKNIASVSSKLLQDNEEDDVEDTEKEKVLKARVKSLEIHVQQLRNIIAKRERANGKNFGKINEDDLKTSTEEVNMKSSSSTSLSEGVLGEEEEEMKSKKKMKKREFNMKNYKKRHVLFRVAYFGWDYNGFAVQEDSSKTIEYELMKALITTRLIENRQSSNYHRCGRTDKGVSAFHQVISLDVRTNLIDGPGVFTYEGCLVNDNGENSNNKFEIEYCKILNSNLPNFIQIIAWAPCIQLDFSARFDCKMRAYKYFFPIGNMCLDRINAAGKKLEGVHDFRNFCKMDVLNGVTEFIRRIENVSAKFVNEESRKNSSSPYDMCVLDVVGNAFLWHQIRCIVSVLFKIGEKLEEPSVIDELLNIEKNPRKPQYGLAAEYPLNLFDCRFENVEWIYEKDSLNYSIKQFHELWTQQSVKSVMIKEALNVLENIEIDDNNKEEKCNNQATCLLPKCKVKNYTPLLDMLKCPSLEEKIETVKKRKKISS